MNRTVMLSAIAAAFASAAIVSSASAQTTKDVAGAYAPVKVPAFGENPRGSMILTADGRYSIIVARADMAKIAAGTRINGTP